MRDCKRLLSVCGKDVLENAVHTELYEAFQTHDEIVVETLRWNNHLVEIPLKTVGGWLSDNFFSHQMGISMAVGSIESAPSDVEITLGRSTGQCGVLF